MRHLFPLLAPFRAVHMNNKSLDTVKPKALRPHHRFTEDGEVDTLSQY
jgi:hypothetical protein